MKVERILVVTALMLAAIPPVMAFQEVTAEDYDAAMKTIRATVQGIPEHLEAQDAASVGTDGATLVEQFTKINTYWNGRGEEEAIALSDRALAAARVFQESGAAGDFDNASRAFTELRGTCMSCHDQYRERDADGNWRIKGGGN